MNLVYNLLKDHPRSDHRWIGLEVERLAISKEMRKIFHYEPPVRLALEALVRDKSWQKNYEFEGQILGIKKNLHEISTEPGGQFEVSAAPRQSILELKKTEELIDLDILDQTETRDWEWLCIGLNPLETPDDMKILPSPRYALMDAHFRKIQSRGREMMRLTTGLQVNLDYASEEEGIQMLRAAFWIVPVVSAIFANSPYIHGKRSKVLSERHLIWRDTDKARSGFLDFIFKADFTLKDYASHVSKVPLMYAYDEKGGVWDPQGICYLDLDEQLKKANALSALRQLFTEVRLKPCCVEVRCFDQLPENYRYAATAMTVGLLYDPAVRESLRDLYSKMSVQDLSALMLEGATTGLENEEILSKAKELLLLSKKGLIGRGLKEEVFLAPAEELIRDQKTPADLLIEEHGEHFQL